MPRRESAATERAMRMIQRGTIPLQAALICRLSPSTVYRALNKRKAEAEAAAQELAKAQRKPKRMPPVATATSQRSGGRA